MKVIKYLTFGLKNKTGINFTGKKSFKNRCSGKSKRKFRIIDFYFNNYLIPFFVIRFEYDPNRSAKIALICYKNGILSYIIAVEGLKENKYTNWNNISLGSARLLSDYKYGTFISCIELRPAKGSKIARSAGCYGIVLNSKDDKTIIRLPSGEERLFHKKSKALLGIISNKNHKFEKKKKAGNNIWLGKKPKVRGVAKNCVDHPHGGGRGKTSQLVLASNFSRRVLKGVFSFNKKKSTKKYIIKSNKKWKKII